MVEAAPLFPKQVKTEILKRADSLPDLFTVLDIFPEEVRLIAQRGATKVNSIAEAKAYLDIFERHNFKPNPYEQEMFTSLFKTARQSNRKTFTAILEAFPKVKPRHEEIEWYVRSASSEKDLKYAVKRLHPANIDIAQLKRNIKAQEVIGKHKKIWDECTDNIAKKTTVALNACLKKITDDKIPTEYAKQALEMKKQFEEIEEVREEYHAGSKRFKKKLLKLIPSVDFTVEQTIDHCPCFFGKRLFHSTGRLRIQAKVKDFDFKTKSFDLKVVKVTKARGVSSDYDAYQDALQMLYNEAENQVGAEITKRFAGLYNSFFWDVYKEKESPDAKGWTEEEFDFLNIVFFLSSDYENELDTALRLMAKRKNCYASAFAYRALFDGLKDELDNYSKWDSIATDLWNSCPQLPVPKDVPQEQASDDTNEKQRVMDSSSQKGKTSSDNTHSTLSFNARLQSNVQKSPDKE